MEPTEFKVAYLAAVADMGHVLDSIAALNENLNALIQDMRLLKRIALDEPEPADKPGYKM